MKIWLLQTLKTEKRKKNNPFHDGVSSARNQANQLFVSKYQLELPKKKEMERFLKEQMKELGYGG